MARQEKQATGFLHPHIRALPVGFLAEPSETSHTSTRRKGKEDEEEEEDGQVWRSEEACLSACSPSVLSHLYMVPRVKLQSLGLCGKCFWPSF